MNKEEKYKEALERARKLYEQGTITESLCYVFPELKESEEEKIRESLLEYLHTLPNHYAHSGVCAPEWIAWLEKQGEQKSINDLTPQKAMDIAVAKCFDEQKPYGQREECVDCQFNYAGECKGYCAMKRGEQNLVNFKEAEKEKSDFVSGKFIQCRKSFNEFKEDNSYWLEYIGDDTYIGRSDNILNQKFHITPRQLYRLFSQEHCIKK